MPIHDWTRVSAGTWHDFHLAWISEIRNVLNDGLLPPDYYAQAEQIAGPMGPDVLTLQAPEDEDTESAWAGGREEGGGVATQAPRTRLVFESEADDYAAKRRTLVIRHSSGDRIVALLELVSPGNKSSQRALESFVDKAIEALYRGFHLLVVDLFPPGPRDPGGIHAAIWGGLGEAEFRPPPDEPLTLAAYSAGRPKRAYVEPTAVGHELMEMPLFLTPEGYVNVPLEATYRAAYRGVARKWREVLEAPSKV
jgi:hypothetical protein